jgi:sigma-B regulation protein RsbU (phosphoserine phosphatase)
MSRTEGGDQESFEELFEDAPCGHLSSAIDGTILGVNRTFERWTGLDRTQLLAVRRFQDLLPRGRIYYETHYLPLLLMQNRLNGIALEIERADGSRLSALVNSVVDRDRRGAPHRIRTAVFDATDRSAYERELRSSRQREQETAERLQRSLLPGEIPAAPGLEVAVTYRPGVSGLQVGGDWYDAFWIEQPDIIALVVGDVVGHGLEAAATMGQLRSAVRALALLGLGPATLLQALDRFADRHDVGSMATLVYAELDLRSGSLRFACAGHPPPLILQPDGAARFLWEGRSLPLDTRLGTGTRAEATVQLERGSTVLLYTDGLIERRTSSLDEDLGRLLAAAASCGGQSPERVAGAIVRALHEPEQLDDVCVLVART